MQGWRNTLFSMEEATNETSYVFNGRVPTTVNYFASPLGDKGRQLTVGLFVPGSVDHRSADAQPGHTESTT